MSSTLGSLGISDSSVESARAFAAFAPGSSASVSASDTGGDMARLAVAVSPLIETIPELTA
eukprot:9923334-Lingulodinium_polyedra.AAC.1